MQFVVFALLGGFQMVNEFLLVMLFSISNEGSKPLVNDFVHLFRLYLVVISDLLLVVVFRSISLRRRALS